MTPVAWLAWRRLAAAFLDWILVGVLAAAIGELVVSADVYPPGEFGRRPGPEPASSAGWSPARAGMATGEASRSRRKVR